MWFIFKHFNNSVTTSGSAKGHSKVLMSMSDVKTNCVTVCDKLKFLPLFETKVKVTQFDNGSLDTISISCKSTLYLDDTCHVSFQFCNKSWSCSLYKIARNWARNLSNQHPNQRPSHQFIDTASEHQYLLHIIHICIYILCIPP